MITYKTIKWIYTVFMMCKGYMRLYLYKIQSGVTFYLQNIHTYCYIHTAEVTIDGYQNCSMTCWCYCNATGLPDMSRPTCVTMKHFPHSWPFVRGIHRFPIYKEPVIRSFGVFFVVSLNKQSGSPKYLAELRGPKARVQPERRLCCRICRKAESNCLPHHRRFCNVSMLSA